MTALASYLGLEPAQNILSLILPDADVQSISESLNIFDIDIFMCNMTKHIDRCAAQRKDAVVQPRPQVGGSVFRNDLSIFHKPYTMTA